MGGREAARVPELGQSHRARDKATTGEIQGRRVHWGLIIEWGGWGIMRNEEEVKDTPKALLPVRVTGGQSAQARTGQPRTAGARGVCAACPPPFIHANARSYQGPSRPHPASLRLEAQDLLASLFLQSLGGSWFMTPASRATA